MSPFIEFDPIFNAASPFIDFYLPRRNLEVSPFIENITQHQNQQIVALSPCRGVALYAGPFLAQKYNFLFFGEIVGRFTRNIVK